MRSGTFGAYYRKQIKSGDIFKLDGFLARSLFDLYSNFTFFLHDPVNGDGIQQHDSRLQEGANAQYLHPYRLFGNQALLTFGGNFHDNQINVGLYPRAKRAPTGVTTRAHAHVTNTAGYAQQGIDLLQGRLHLEGGLRFDYFRFDVIDKLDRSSSGMQGASRFQPKANLRASGLDVIDLHITKQLRHGIDFNLGVDNLTNKKYFETQNYFQSRLRPGDPAIARIHGTPGYPFTLTVGLSFHVFGK